MRTGSRERKRVGDPAGSKEKMVAIGRELGSQEGGADSNDDDDESDSEDTRRTYSSDADGTAFMKSLSCGPKAPEQCVQLQRLGQPYFLPISRRSGWHFLLLLLSMSACVAGVGLVLLTGVLMMVFGISEKVAKHVLSGTRDLVDQMWTNGAGVAIMCCCLLGTLCFYFWRRQLQGKWPQWFLLGVIVLVLLAINAINTGIGFVANFLTQALVDKKSDMYYRWLTIYATCFVFALPVLTLQHYIKYKLGILWREWLTSSLIDGWMSNRAYYILNANDEQAAEGGVDNPDQRISEDVNTFTNQTLVYLVGTIDAVMMFCLNIFVLFSINTTLAVVLLSWATFMTTLLVILSRNLVRINYSQLKLEADFRYGLVHVRDNSEAIAFYAGEKSERSETGGRLGKVVTNYNRLIIWKVGIAVVQRFYSYGSIFMPYFIMAPFILSGDLKYGDFSQANFTFRMVEDALSFIATSIDSMAAWAAGITRLEGFQGAVVQVAENCKGAATESGVSEGTDVVVRNAELRTPGAGQQLLIGGLSFSLSRGERLLVVGPSGCGKTSLLRMICGLWQPASGQLETPPVGDLLFVPQKPYMLLGSLREQLSYPKGKDAFEDDQLRQALQDACLSHFLDRYPDLSINQDWSRLLSLGEQQRLSFARVLLNQPSFLVLDEATSGLDVATERKMYSLLMERGTAVISVGHRPTLKEFHTTVLELQGAPTGGWKLVPAAGYEFAA